MQCWISTKFTLCSFLCSKINITDNIFWKCTFPAEACYVLISQTTFSENTLFQQRHADGQFAINKHLAFYCNCYCLKLVNAILGSLKSSFVFILKWKSCHSTCTWVHELLHVSLTIFSLVKLLAGVTCIVAGKLVYLATWWSVVLIDCHSEKSSLELQLQAGCCILKLARQPVFVDMMTYKHLHMLASLVLVSIRHKYVIVRCRVSQTLHINWCIVYLSLTNLFVIWLKFAQWWMLDADSDASVVYVVSLVLLLLLLLLLHTLWHAVVSIWAVIIVRRMRDHQNCSVMYYIPQLYTTLCSYIHVPFFQLLVRFMLRYR